MTEDRGLDEARDRDDDYGRAFVALLRDAGQGDSRVDMAGPSLRAAQTLRRRRRRGAAAVAVAGVTTLVSVVAVTAMPDRIAQPATPTVAVPTDTRTPAASPDGRSTAPAPATVTVNATLRQLPTGDSTGVQWVQDGGWHQADGRVVAVRLPADADQGVEAFSLGPQLLVTGSTAAGRRSTVIVGPDGKSDRLRVAGHAFTRGPRGSVLWLEERAGQAVLARLTTDEVIRRYPLPRPVADIVDTTLAATQDAVYLSTADTVTRYTTTESAVTDPQTVTGAEQVVTSDPDGDAVVLSDDNLCTSVATATSGPRAWECRYHVTAVSRHGQYRYGYDVDTEDGTVTDNAGHTLMILKNVRSVDALIDDTGTLRLTGGGPGPDDTSSQNGVVVCHLPRTCNRVGQPSTVLINSGRDPIVLIR